MASSLRLRILRLTVDEPLTNREIAERLGRNPATTLHHVRTLVDTGFLVAEPAPAWRARVEGDPVSGDAVVLAAQYRRRFRPSIARDARDVPHRKAEAAGLDRLRASRLGLRLRPEEREEFEDRLQVLLDEYAARPPSQGGEAWSVFLALHPDVSRG